MFDVRRLKVLREVAARGSFSGAAEGLAFTQSAVSQQIAALEREAGTTLVERGARGVRLTEAGQALVRHADAILARLDDAEQELAAIAGLRGGRLRLGSFPSAGVTLVPQAAAAFHERYPDVELRLVEAEPEDALPLLRAGEIDLTLAYDYEPAPEPTAPDIERLPLLDDPLEVVLPRGHRLAGQARVAAGELDGEPWITGPPPGSCARMTLHTCRTAGFEPKVAFESNDCQTMQAFVAAGVGVALLPRLGLSPLNAAVEVRPLDPPAARRVWAAWLAEGYRSPASAAMLEILREVSRGFGAPVELAAAS
ncbi:MAG: LysR substrate-binding domain-containing protein [Actinomycetota bacterium]|nr:LysR substrate-binding domain-containing protein [Actinomycetota bacterium]